MASATKKAAKRQRVEEDRNGYDGAVVMQREIRSGNRQVITQSVRARPGTFEWRYGREGNEALYHAGSQFAQMWERAGIASAGSATLSDAGGSDWKGLPDARCVALDAVREMVRDVGKLSSARLVSYCVDGKTTADLSRSYGVSEKEMAAVLNMDLRGLAIHLRFL